MNTGAALWFLLLVFLGIGMPAIGLIAGLVLWRKDRQIGGLITLVSVLALAAVIPALMEGDFLSDGGYPVALLLQSVLTVLLVIYALFSSTRHEDPRSATYRFMVVVAVLGVLWNAIVFGVPLILRLFGG